MLTINVVENTQTSLTKRFVVSSMHVITSSAFIKLILYKRNYNNVNTIRKLFNLF